MENASKAILIAASIIIAIAIISIAVSIYISVSDVVTNINLDSTTISTHNSRFVEYVGEVTGSNVKICLSNVLSNNFNDNTLPEFKIEVFVTDRIVNASLPSGQRVDNNVFEYIRFDDSSKEGSGKQAICDYMSDYIKTNYIYTGSITYNELGLVSKIEFVRR